MIKITRRDFLDTFAQTTTSLAVGATLVSTRSSAAADDSSKERVRRSYPTTLVSPTR